MTATVGEMSTWFSGRELIKGLDKNCPKNWSRKGETVSEWLEKERQPFWAGVYLKREGIRRSWLLKSPSACRNPQSLFISVSDAAVRLAPGILWPVTSHRGPQRATRSPRPAATDRDRFLPDREQNSSIQVEETTELLSNYQNKKNDVKIRPLANNLNLKERHFTILKLGYINHTLH